MLNLSTADRSLAPVPRADDSDGLDLPMPTYQVGEWVLTEQMANHDLDRPQWYLHKAQICGVQWNPRYREWEYSLYFPQSPAPWLSDGYFDPCATIASALHPLNHASGVGCWVCPHATAQQASQQSQQDFQHPTPNTQHSPLWDCGATLTHATDPQTHSFDLLNSHPMPHGHTVESWIDFCQSSYQIPPIPQRTATEMGLYEAMDRLVSVVAEPANGDSVNLTEVYEGVLGIVEMYLYGHIPQKLSDRYWDFREGTIETILYRHPHQPS